LVMISSPVIVVTLMVSLLVGRDDLDAPGLGMTARPVAAPYT